MHYERAQDTFSSCSIIVARIQPICAFGQLRFANNQYTPRCVVDIYYTQSIGL